MSGLTSPNSLDLIAQDADGAVLLVLVEEEPWGTYSDEEELLMTKLDTYGIYATSQLLEDYPQVAGSPVRVRIDCPTAPTSAIQSPIDFSRQQFEAHGIEVSINVNPALAEKGASGGPSAPGESSAGRDARRSLVDRLRGRRP